MLGHGGHDKSIEFDLWLSQDSWRIALAFSSILSNLRWMTRKKQEMETSVSQSIKSINNQINHYIYTVCIYIYIYILSYIIIHHHTSSYIIIYYHILAYIIIYYHILSHIITYYHILSYIIIYYHILSYIIIYYHIHTHPAPENSLYSLLTNDCPVKTSMDRWVFS